MKLLILVMNIGEKVYFWFFFGNMDFKMFLIYFNGDYKNVFGGIGLQFKVEVYVGGINFRVI